MKVTSVIIPNYQCEAGILTRALESISKQLIPDDWSVEVIIVDYGSPVAAKTEIRDRLPVVSCFTY